MPAATASRVLPQPEWRAREAAHAARVDAWTAGHRERARERRPHPVEGFLFTYYSHRPNQLRRWHPGHGTALAGAAERTGWRWYADVGGGAVGVDVDAFLAERRDSVLFVRDLLLATASRPAHLGCFGLHEWAMVYRRPPEQVRHARWPLRLGPDGTDAVVERHRVRCSHFDAYRFFTPDAAPLNTLRPSRSAQVDLEQPGCLHATMDLYKWSYKLSPAVPSELVGDCFELAREVRVLDMRASPYDLSALGHEPVRIETPEGKAEYVEAQRAFAERAAVLRRRLLAVCDALLAEE
ncbi:MAG: 3-methyladenine DNA glycosylase [Actinomycetes bacterium]